MCCYDACTPPQRSGPATPAPPQRHRRSASAALPRALTGTRVPLGAGRTARGPSSLETGSTVKPSPRAPSASRNCSWSSYAPPRSQRRRAAAPPRCRAELPSMPTTTTQTKPLTHVPRRQTQVPFRGVVHARRQQAPGWAVGAGAAAGDESTTAPGRRQMRVSVCASVRNHSLNLVARCAYRQSTITFYVCHSGAHGDYMCACAHAP